MDYYYVYYPYGNAPRYKHATKESAIAEAMRLAEEQPTRKFEILHCIGYVEAEKPKPLFTSLEEAEASQEIDESRVMHDLFKHFPAPPLPQGFGRWAYRGTGWRQDQVLFSYFPTIEKGWSPPLFGNTMGDVNTHYLEAVR